jgi:hypothetical protein
LTGSHSSGPVAHAITVAGTGGGTGRGRDELRAQLLLTLLHVIGRLQGGDGGAAGVKGLLRLGQQVRPQHPRCRVVTVCLEDGEIVARGDRGGDDEQQGDGQQRTHGGVLRGVRGGE